MFNVPVRVRRSRTFCTYQGTKNHVFHSVIVTPQRIRVAPPAPFETREGPIVTIRGRGYHGQAQTADQTASVGALEQAKAQVTSGEVIVRVFVTDHTDALRGTPQLASTLKIARLVGARLARTVR